MASVLAIVGAGAPCLANRSQAPGASRGWAANQASKFATSGKVNRGRGSARAMIGQD